MVHDDAIPLPVYDFTCEPRADPRLPSPEPPKMLPAEIPYHLKLLPRRRLRTELTRSNDGARANEVDEISDRLGRSAQLAKGIRPLPCIGIILDLVGNTWTHTKNHLHRKT